MRTDVPTPEPQVTRSPPWRADDWLMVLLLGAAGALFVAARKLGHPILEDWGAALIGGAAATYGLAGIVRREFRIGRRAYARTYRGVAAVLFSLVFINAAILFWIFAAAHATGRLNAPLPRSASARGIAFLVIASFLALVGAARFIGPVPATDLKHDYDRSVGGKLESAILLFTALCLGTLGLAELIMPDAFHALLRGVLNKVLS